MKRRVAGEILFATNRRIYKFNTVKQFEYVGVSLT